MTIRKKTLKCYNWNNIFNFRAELQEYLKSKGRIHRPQWHILSGQAKNLSLSENSGYNYIPVH